MFHFDPMAAVFAIAALTVLVWGVIEVGKAVTQAWARAWFAEKEKHHRRIVELSKEDTE